MGDFLKQPYVFAIVAALLIAAIAWSYERTTTNDPVQLKKTFYKTLFVSVFVLFGLTWYVNRPEPVLTEPFVQH